MPAAGGLHASLPDAQAEPNLERRSKLALDNAGQALTEAREAYAAGDRTRLEARAAEIGENEFHIRFVIFIDRRVVAKPEEESAQELEVV